MKVLHVPYTYFPDPVGGTEVYVAGLANTLRQAGIDVHVAAPGANQERYSHLDVPVTRFAIDDVPQDLREIYGKGNRATVAQFDKILERERPSIVHLHARTRGVSLETVRCAKRKRIPTLFTYHTPSVTCQRETLIRWGSRICDGKLRRNTCTSCTIHSHGAPIGLAATVAVAGKLLGPIVERARISGRASTALRLSALTRRNHNALHSLFEEVDAVVALCEWTREVLQLNGVPGHKIYLSRHGVLGPTETTPPSGGGSLPLRTVWLGRASPVKGIDLLIDALERLDKSILTLDIYAQSQTTREAAYLKQIKTRVADNPAIRFLDPVTPDEVVTTLHKYDVALVPSLTLETGPLVVLEAFAAGIPVVGSNMGGIAELVDHQTNGLLIDDYQSAAAWATTLASLAADSARLQNLQRGITAPRTLQDVAEDMIELYYRLSPK